MKTLGKIILVVLAVLAVFVIVFNVNDDVWYETHVQAVRIFAKEDGIVCLTPYTCVGVIHNWEDLYKANMTYMEEHGVNSPGRPGELYSYNPDMNAYIRWYSY